MYHTHAKDFLRNMSLRTVKHFDLVLSGVWWEMRTKRMKSKGITGYVVV